MKTSTQTTQPSISPRPAAPNDAWIEIRSSRGRLLCRLDAERLLLEVKQKGQPVELVDLRPLLGGWLNSPISAISGERVQIVD